MKNFFRFLIGLVAFFIILILGIVLLIVFSPAIIAISAILLILFIKALRLFVSAGFFAFIWYLSREEPKRKKSKNYSIKQGKNV